ncbi:hypothetical protein [Chamaesiphon sp. GL140_3_metabinner_50]|uniref:hypothetical protein n=1 Tax=Chamaesiphon sp. GL140_3_metabinner_50 TaxID=2970812 RepID=UPI0025CD0E8C|nr:hypothetical protein [Chamaesiphon sp. GL140_3_metabinner_50]
MTLTLNLPAELEQYLLQEAREQGVSIEAMTLRLLTSVVTKQKPADVVSSKQPRVFGQYQGRISMSEDFDDPLPDSFWLGES